MHSEISNAKFKMQNANGTFYSIPCFCILHFALLDPA